MAEDYLAAIEVAELVGRSRSTVCRWCREGILPGVLVGSQWIVPRAALADFVVPRPGQPVLDEETVRRIKRRFPDAEDAELSEVRELARELDVDYRTVLRVVEGATWADVELKGDSNGAQEATATAS